VLIDKLAFHDAPVQLTSPIGARVLQALYHKGHLKLKKPATRSLLALEAYIETEAAFRADVAEILAAEGAKRQRLEKIIANPTRAHPDELSPYFIDKVMSARLGHGVYGDLQIAGITCYRALAMLRRRKVTSIALRARSSAGGLTRQATGEATCHRTSERHGQTHHGLL
jgi:hypothetical protein